MMQKTTFFDFTDESGVLRTSILATLFIAVAGIAFGLISGSFSIIFDGIYSLVDAGMSALSLIVVQLITSYTNSKSISPRMRERFNMGFWHLEPIVLALNGILLTGITIYAFINAISSLMDGGRELEFGVAVIYSIIVVVVCITMALIEARANRQIRSDFVAMDIKGWIMSASITTALVIAFCSGYMIQDTSLRTMTPYIDPAVLTVVCIGILPLPVPVIRQALSEIFLVTPLDLKQHVDRVAQRFAVTHKLLSYRAYVAKIGRSREIEVYFIVPPDFGPRAVSYWDALRDEFSETLGQADQNRWLTVVFTADKTWAE